MWFSGYKADDISHPDLYQAEDQEQINQNLDMAVKIPFNIVK